jgi:hypothetical protein
MVTLDVTHVFRQSHGPRGLLDMLDRQHAGHGLKYNQVQMWLHRRQIPAKWVGLILYALEREGHRCIEFLIDESEFSSANTGG